MICGDFQCFIFYAFRTAHGTVSMKKSLVSCSVVLNYDSNLLHNLCVIKYGEHPKYELISKIFCCRVFCQCGYNKINI